MTSTARTGWTIELSIADYAAIEPEIAAFFVDHGVVGKPAFVSQMVIEEIVRNLVEHTPPNAADEAVSISVLVSSDDVTVTIEDQRPPFSPTDAPELDASAPLEDRRAGGMGLHLVRSLPDSFSYERVGDRNRLTTVVRR